MIMRFYFGKVASSVQILPFKFYFCILASVILIHIMPTLIKIYSDYKIRNRKKCLNRLLIQLRYMFNKAVYIYIFFSYVFLCRS